MLTEICLKFSFLQPLGYKVDDTKLKRAGLDYWPYPLVGCILYQLYIAPRPKFKSIRTLAWSTTWQFDDE